MVIKKEQRDTVNEKLEFDKNRMKYMVANIEGRTIFLQEAEWVLNTKESIPKGKLISHKDGNPMNNEFSNLELVDENSEYGDLHQNSNKVFHEENYKNNKDFIERNFKDIYEILF